VGNFLCLLEVTPHSESQNEVVESGKTDDAKEKTPTSSTKGEQSVVVSELPTTNSFPEPESVILPPNPVGFAS
jgi:hypothetical protein